MKTKKTRSSRKFSDEELIRLNSIGLSLVTMAKIFQCHPTAITHRLQALKIQPVDTRRSFMEDILMKLSEEQQNWLADLLGPHYNIKEYLLDVLVKEFIKQQGNKTNV